MAVTSKKGKEALNKLNTLPAFNENTQSTHDTQRAQHTHNTQRKQKHPRINMAFYGDNLEYLREAAYRNRISVTEYVNKLVEEDRQRNGR